MTIRDTIKENIRDVVDYVMGGSGVDPDPPYEILQESLFNLLQENNSKINQEY